MATSSQGKVVLMSRKMLNYVESGHETEMLRFLASQPGFVATLERLSLHKALRLSQVLPLAVRLVISTKLSTVEVNIEGNGVDLFSLLALSRAPLQTIWIESTKHDCSCLGKCLSLLHLGPTLHSLGLTVSSNQQNEDLPRYLIKTIANHLPNLQALSVNARYADIEPLKVLKKLTHLYIQLNEDHRLDGIFALKNVAAAQASVRRLIASTPPLVGSHLVVTPPSGPVFTILEYALREKKAKEILSAIITEGYQLSFAHNGSLFPSQPVSVVDYCPFASLKLLVELKMPLQWQVQTPAYSYSTSLFSEVLRKKAAKKAAWVFETCWQQALQQGLSPQQLLLGPMEDGIQDCVLFHPNVAEDGEKLEYILGHPEIFGNVATICDRMNRTLLFYDFQDVDLLEQLDGMAHPKVSWKHIDATGRNALEYHSDERNWDALGYLVSTLTDAEFVKSCTPEVWPGDPEAELRLKALIPKSRWKTYLRAYMMKSITSGEQFTVAQDKELAVLMAEVLLEPVDQSQIKSGPLQGLEMVHMAYLLGIAFAQLLLDRIAAELGLDKAFRWANTKDSHGRTVRELPLPKGVTRVPLVLSFK